MENRLKDYTVTPSVVPGGEVTRVEIRPRIDWQCAGVCVFSALPDLYGRRAYKGDLHTHTCHSTGTTPLAV